MQKKNRYTEPNRFIPKEEGDLIAFRLKATKLTHQALANHCGIKRSAISSYIKREMNPSPKIAFHITEVLDGLGY